MDWVRAFGDGGDATGGVPGEDDLGGGDVVFGGEGEDGGVVAYFGVAWCVIGVDWIRFSKGINLG